jgi:F-type H+-transporting ATPase subunit delta
MNQPVVGPGAQGAGCTAEGPVLEPSRLPGGVLCAGSSGNQSPREARNTRHSEGTPLFVRANEDSADVAAATTGVSGLAERYAAALFELADERRALDAVAGDLRALLALIDESADLRRLIRSPVLGRAAQGNAVAALAERAAFQVITRNFLGLLARNRRLFALPGMIRGFLAQLAERRGEVTAEVTAPQELSPAQRETLGEQLRAAVGRKVAVDIRIDPSLLGGLVVRLGSRMVDASIKSKLHRLQLAMKGVQ